MPTETDPQSTEKQNTDENSGLLCEVCKKNPFKYRCPACNMKTCSLACVNGHKKQNNCDGLRKPMKYVPLKEFNDDIITDDYYYLYHLAQVVDNNNRVVNTFGSAREYSEENKPQKVKLPKYLTIISNQAKQRKMNIKFMPKGMTRQKENHTRYIYKKGFIEWTIEWIFPSVVPLLKEKSLECELTTIRDSLHQLLHGHKNATTKTLLNKYRSVDVDGLVVLTEKLDEGHKNEYYMLPMQLTWREALAGLTLIEFPTIYIVLASELHQYKLIQYQVTELEPWRPPQPKEKNESEKRNTNEIDEETTELPSKQCNVNPDPEPVVNEEQQEATNSQ